MAEQDPTAPSDPQGDGAQTGRDAFDDEIIRLAYSAAADPVLFERFFTTLDESASGEVDQVAPDTPVERLERMRNRMDRVRDHIDHAVSLSESQGQRFNASPAASRVVLNESAPAALLGRDGRVIQANAVARNRIGLVPGQALDSDRMDPSDMRSLRDAVQRIGSLTDGDLACHIRVFTGEDEPPLLMALVRTTDSDGSPALRLSLLGSLWDKNVADRFQSAMGLSDSELAVLRALVEGESLADLAERRGRSVGTVRNQLKAVFRKTGTSSQTQLISLFAGFSQLTRHLVPNVSPVQTGQAGPDDVEILRRPDGTSIQIDYAGPRNGKPVFVFNGQVVGHALLPETVSLLYRRNIRLIMPWRAGWAGTQPDATGELSPDSSRRDMALVLDHLGIDRVAVLAEAVGGIHALHAMRGLTSGGVSRIRSMVWVAPTFPVRTVADMRHQKSAGRSLVYLARYTPSLVEAFVRFGMSKMDLGHDTDMLLNVLKGSEPEERMLRTPGVMDALRDNLARVRAQDMIGPTADLKLEFSRWTQIDDAPPVPVHLLYGYHHFSTGDTWPKAYAERFATVTQTCVPNAAGLFALNNYGMIFDAFDAIDP